MAFFGQAAKYGSATAQATAVSFGGLGNRFGITVWNIDATTDVFIGFDNQVTVNNGIPLPALTNIQLDLGPAIQLWAIGTASSVANNIRFMEGY